MKTPLFPNLAVSNLVALLRPFVPFCALLRTCVGALLRAFALICAFLEMTAFRTNALGNCRAETWPKNRRMKSQIAALQNGKFQVVTPAYHADTSRGFPKFAVIFRGAIPNRSISAFSKSQRFWDAKLWISSHLFFPGCLFASLCRTCVPSSATARTEKLIHRKILLKGMKRYRKYKALRQYPNTTASSAVAFLVRKGPLGSHLELC